MAGLCEREGHLVYNVAALPGPDGQLAGKYRKVCLPRNEIVSGVTPGQDYPVFETRFGKVGSCLLRRLLPRGGPAAVESRRGGDRLAGVGLQSRSWRAARACENHVYLVSSTYEDFRATGCSRPSIDRSGGGRGAGDACSGRWRWRRWILTGELQWISLGDFKAEIPTASPRLDAAGKVTQILH